MNSFCVLLSTVVLIGVSIGAPTTHWHSGDDGIDDGFDADILNLIEEDPTSDSFYDYALDVADYGELESYACQKGSYQCKNSGKCSLRISGNLDLHFCTCTSKYVGSTCTQRKDQMSNSIRTQPQIKDSFQDCMKNTSIAEESLTIFSNCINQNNICWLQKGGKEALKCFFWLSDNALQLGVVEENINEKSRMQIYEEVFQKLVSKITDKSNEETTHAQPSPVYSMQVSIFEYPHHEPPTNNPYSFYSQTTSSDRYPQQPSFVENRFGPLRLSIEAPSYHPYQTPHSYQLEDRNMVPGEDYEEPGNDFLSHITDPYKLITEEDTTIPNQEMFNMYPLDGSQGSNFDLMSNTIMHDEEMTRDTVLEEEVE